MTTKPLITIRAVLDDEEVAVHVGDFEPEQVEPVLALLKVYPLEAPDGRLCHVTDVRYAFGANGDRPHIEVTAASEDFVAGFFAKAEHTEAPQ